MDRLPTQPLVNFSIRIKNRRSIVRMLYDNEYASKHDISEALGLSLPTVSAVLQQLSDERLLVETVSEISSGGRRPRLYRLNYDKHISSAVRVGKAGYSIILGNLKRDIIARKYFPCPFIDCKSYWRGIMDELHALAGQNGISRGSLMGTVFLFDGFVDMDSAVEFLDDKTQVTTFVRQEYEQLPSYFVFADNTVCAEAHAQALALGFDCAAYLRVDEEIHGAMIVDGKIVRGRNLRVAQFGHICVVPGGRRCACGKDGCLDAYCSTLLLKKEGGGTLAGFFNTLEGDRSRRGMYEQYLVYLATGISNIILCADTPVILGGELSEYIGSDLGHLRHLVEKRLNYTPAVPMLHQSRILTDSALEGGMQITIDHFMRE